ncbi:hypothetical protein F7725_024883, partial [Dissostichus mawsoni]
TKHNDAQNSSDSENEERIETESENEEKETGIENEEIGSEDKKIGSEDKKIGSEDKKIGSEDKETESEDKETGIENEETGIENEETGTEDKEMEGEDMEIEREEMENEAVTSESTRVKAPSEFVFCYSYQTPPIQLMFRRTISSTMRPLSNVHTQLDPVVLWSSSQKIKMGSLFRATGMMKTLNYAMYCFSCRMFLNDDKYKSRSTWKSGGVNRWRQAKVRTKEHCLQ